MGNVNASGIWTPDETDNLDPTAWSAAMGDSIHNGIGVRLNRQEQAIGLKAVIPVGTTMTDASNVVAPYQIIEGLQCFTQGLTLTAGIASVTVPGLYLVSCSAALESTTNAPGNLNRSIALQIYQNAGWLAGCEVRADQKFWQTAQATTAMNCIAGDTISVRWYSAGPTPGTGSGTLASNQAMHTVSIVLITPIGA